MSISSLSSIININTNIKYANLNTKVRNYNHLMLSSMSLVTLSLTVKLNYSNLLEVIMIITLDRPRGRKGCAAYG